MLIWVPGGFFVSLLLFGYDSGGFVILFLVVWLIVWICGGYFALRAILWTLCGREHIRLSVDHVHLCRRALFMSRLRGLPRDAPLVLRLRDHRDKIYRGADDDAEAIPNAASFEEGQLMFVTAEQKIGMGVDLDAQEAKRLATTLWSVFPELEPRR